MNNRLARMFLLCSVLLGMLPVQALAEYRDLLPEIWDGTVAESYAGGTGTSDDPYLISNGAQLAKFRDEVNSGASGAGYAALTNDIYLNDTSGWQSWDENTAPKNDWTPIGNPSHPFNGYFDGRGFTVYGAYICRSTEDNVGLFGQLFDVRRQFGVRIFRHAHTSFL